MMRQEQLQPPRPSEHSISLDDEFRNLACERWDELIDEAMTGRGDFFNMDPRDPHAWDAEQAQALFPVIAAMMRLPTSTDEQRWRGLMAAVRLLASEYAQSRTER